VTTILARVLCREHQRVIGIVRNRGFLEFTTRTGRDRRWLPVHEGGERDNSFTRLDLKTTGDVLAWCKDCGEAHPVPVAALLSAANGESDSVVLI
jgi:hypothetical protein